MTTETNNGKGMAERQQQQNSNANSNGKSNGKSNGNARRGGTRGWKGSSGCGGSRPSESFALLRMTTETNTGKDGKQQRRQQLSS